MPTWTMISSLLYGALQYSVGCFRSACVGLISGDTLEPFSPLGLFGSFNKKNKINPQTKGLYILRPSLAATLLGTSMSQGEEAVLGLLHAPMT
jgi:hypothetical protein